MAGVHVSCDTAAVIPPVRLLLVDDNHDFLMSAAAHLGTRPQLSIAGAVRSGEEALKLLKSFPVDLVLLDLNMHGLDGLETSRQLKARPGAPKVIIVTLQDAPEYRRCALTAGVDGFISKAEFTTALFPLIATLFPRRNPVTTFTASDLCVWSNLAISTHAEDCIVRNELLLTSV